MGSPLAFSENSNGDHYASDSENEDYSDGDEFDDNDEFHDNAHCRPVRVAYIASDASAKLQRRGIKRTRRGRQWFRKFKRTLIAEFEWQTVLHRTNGRLLFKPLRVWNQVVSIGYLVDLVD
jgi:hypothetical protein